MNSIANNCKIDLKNTNTARRILTKPFKKPNVVSLLGIYQKKKCYNLENCQVIFICFDIREQRYREELDLLRSEVDKCREGETNWRRRLEQREGQLLALKGELEAEQKTVTTLEVEVKELQSKLAKDDNSFRNEVKQF